MPTPRRKNQRVSKSHNPRTLSARPASSGGEPSEHGKSLSLRDGPEFRIHRQMLSARWGPALHSEHGGVSLMFIHNYRDNAGLLRG